MDELGYEELNPPSASGKSIYTQYTNKAGHVFKHYGMSSRGKRRISFNLHDDNILYCHITEDGGTRTCYHGVIPTLVFLIELLDNVT